MKIGATRKLAASVTAAGLILAAGAIAAPIGNGVSIQALYDKAGNPEMGANFIPNGNLAKPSWSKCPPPNVNICTPASSSQFLRAGPTPAGTVFQASATYRGQTYIARTAPWQGTVQATSPPALEGRPRYQAAVRPEGASWAGGWGGEFDFLSIEACRTRSATHCVNLSAAEGEGFSSRPAIVGAWFTGWYLFAFDQRLAKDTAFAEPGYPTAAGIPPIRAGATVARSAPAGPIIGPTPPKVRILRNASTAAGKVLVARIRCSVTCHVLLQVGDNRTGSSARVTLTGSALVGVPREQLKPGTLDVTLYVDSGPFINGKTRLR
jgi:hypothetical protein